MDNLAERTIEEEARIIELDQQHSAAVHRHKQRPCEGGFASPTESRTRYCETVGKFCQYRFYINCQKYTGQKSTHK